MSKKCFREKTGFTLIEALIAVNLIGLSIYFGSSTIGQITKMKVNAQLYMNVNLAKRNLISILQNNTAWLYTINGNGSEFDCLKNITGKLSDPGCEGKSNPAGYPFTIYSDSNAIYYDPINSATAGFDNNGEVCNTFDAANGNPSCPYRATVRWRPVCDMAGGVKCHQPAIEIFGEIQVKRNTAVFNIQKSNYSYQLIRPFVNCPVQAVDFKTASLQWTNFPVTGQGFINGSYLTVQPAAAPGDGFVYATQVFSCDDHILNFRQHINIAGGFTKDDAQNIASVCISDPNQGNLCLFEWRQDRTTWSLWLTNPADGTQAKVFDMPVGPKPRFDNTTIFSFSAKRGLVQFFVDNEIYYVFNSVWPRNYSVKIIPPPSNYSDGIEPY